ncbi:MAG: thiamine pyrophosphate-dependent enzyme [Myxococcota bacterium]|nr:thiamine pyrophosphate-dependent enzyme [Myxococcota bacterium]
METLASPASLANGLCDDGSVDPADAHNFSDDIAVALFDHMVLLRLCEEKLAALEAARESPPRGEPLRGGEAATLGAMSAMHDDDWVFPGGHRFAAALWRGVSLDTCVQDVLGNLREGAPRGESGVPMTTRTPSERGPWKRARVVPASRTGASQVPHAVGVAWAARLQKREEAVLVLFEDRATSSADFHAGLNFAGISRAPVVAVCCIRGLRGNAGDAIEDRGSRGKGRAVAYGVTDVRVDGTDIVAVRNVTREARARAVSGMGSTLIEAVIDPGKEADPLARLGRHLRARGIWGEERQGALAAEMSAEVDRALADASAAVRPSLNTLFDDVYAELPWHLEEQRSESAACR